MSGSEEHFPASFGRKQIERASNWVARHERGLSDAEAKEFESWLEEAPGNEACFFEQQIEWASFDTMDEWRPEYASRPNPDLLKAPGKSWGTLLAISGAAAVLALGGFFVLSSFRTSETLEVVSRGVVYKSQNNEKHFLDDGSSFYLLAGSEIEVEFSDAERSITLVRGEAEFSVAHDMERPFTVRSAAGRVTALGTVFSVKQSQESWEVFVTEGRVRIDESKSASTEEGLFTAELVAGQKIVEDFSDNIFAPLIDTFAEQELQLKLEWKDQIIDMISAPLEEILLEFRRHDSREVVIEDENLRRMQFTVAIEVDNLDDFIDLIELTARVKATSTDVGGIILTRISD